MVTHTRRLDKIDLIGLTQIKISIRFGLEIGLPHMFQESDRHTLSSRLHVCDICDHRTTDTVTKQDDLVWINHVWLYYAQICNQIGTNADEFISEL